MTNEEIYELKVQHKGKGTAAIIFGIISLIVCLGPISFICGIVAIILGIVAKKKSGNTTGTAGLVMGIIGVVLSLLLFAGMLGIMGPQYVKYTGKANTSADMQLCDVVKTSIRVSLADNSVLQDKESAEFLVNYADGEYHSIYEIFASDCLFAESVKEGMDVYSYDELMQSVRTKGAETIMFCIDGYDVTVKIAGTDIEAN